MYSVWLVLAAIAAAIFIWLGVLTFLIWKQGNFLTSLFPKSGERDIRKKFKELLFSIEEFKGDLGKTKEALEDLAKDGKLHIQRVELLRYNPYEDTGGDISFSVALLNDKGTGVVVTSLHARSGTRVFAKPIHEGKAQKQQLSKEEQEVVSKAMERT